LETVDDSWYERYLGQDRIAKFLAATASDHELMATVVEWDREMRGELYKALSDWEIALRNAYDAAMCQWWKGDQHWLLDPNSPVRRKRNHEGVDENAKSRNAIDKSLKRMKKDDPIGQLISSLNLGFWRYLTVRAREKSLWVPALHRAFPRRADRYEVDKKIGQLHWLRNRIAHHEPVFHHDARDFGYQVSRACELVRPEVTELLEARGGIMNVWKWRPIDPPSRHTVSNVT
jgi:hypothetical protein